MKISELFPEVVAEDILYEFKSMLSQDNPSKWAKTIVGFANSEKGGTLFVGVSDNGEAFGLDFAEIDRTKNLIAQVNDRAIFPHAKIKYSLKGVDDSAERFVLCVKVASSETIIRYRKGDYSEIVYIRGDGNSIPANPEDIIALAKRRYGVDNETTDIKYNENDWKGYLDLCRCYRQGFSVPTKKELQNEEIISADNFVKSGFLMFCDKYDGDDTLICCRLWKGMNKVGVLLDSARFKGSIPVVFENTVNFLERNTKTGWRKTSNGGRENIRSYPQNAIREALVNAIAHRDYSIQGTQIDVDIYNDRIEIVSPGSWLLPMGYAEYPVGSIPSIRRNSIIAATLDVANLMERGGTGFLTMLESYKGYSDHLQPVVSIYPGFLNLKLFDVLYENEEITRIVTYSTKQEDVLLLLKENGPMKVKDLQSEFSYTNRTRFLNDIINPLIDFGEIYRDGSIKSPTAMIKLKQKT